MKKTSKKLFVRFIKTLVAVLLVSQFVPQKAILLAEEEVPADETENETFEEIFIENTEEEILLKPGKEETAQVYTVVYDFGNKKVEGIQNNVIKSEAAKGSEITLYGSEDVHDNSGKHGLLGWVTDSKAVPSSGVVSAEKKIEELVTKDYFHFSGSLYTVNSNVTFYAIWAAKANGTLTPSTPSTPETPVVPEIPENEEEITPVVPEIPVTPEVSVTPETPVIPETPADPETPVIPEIPETEEEVVPVIPELPVNPETPVTPVLPDTPSVPETPEIPETPLTPETEEEITPVIPVIPELPVNPETPDDPEASETPDIPAVPETPSVPDIPVTPEIPVIPEIPSNPETPVVPETPEAEEAIVPVTPVTPMTPETPSDETGSEEIAIPSEKTPMISEKKEESIVVIGEEKTVTEESVPVAASAPVPRTVDVVSVPEPKVETLSEAEIEKILSSETITESIAPQALLEGRFALANLLCVAATALLGIVTLLAKSESDEDEEEQYRRNRWMKTAAVLVFLAGVIVFVMTENVTLPMTWTDRYTVINAVLLAVSIVTTYFGLKKNRDEECEEANA